MDQQKEHLLEELALLPLEPSVDLLFRDSYLVFQMLAVGLYLRLRDSLPTDSKGLSLQDCLRDPLVIGTLLLTASLALFVI